VVGQATLLEIAAVVEVVVVAAAALVGTGPKDAWMFAMAEEQQVLATTAKALDMFNVTALRQAADPATVVVRMATWPVNALKTVAQMIANAMDVEVLDIFQGSVLASLSLAHQEKTVIGVDLLITWLENALMEQARRSAITATRWAT